MDNKRTYADVIYALWEETDPDELPYLIGVFGSLVRVQAYLTDINYPADAVRTEPIAFPGAAAALAVWNGVAH